MGHHEPMSLIRMLKVFGYETWSAVSYLSGMCADWRLWCQILQNRHRIDIQPLDIPLESRAQVIFACKRLGETARHLDMVAAAAAAERAEKESFDLLAAPIGYDAHRLQQVAGALERLLYAFMDELKARQVMTLSPRHAGYFSSTAAFGESVETAFPSTAFDIAEAANCRALGRWTASVMHLMRVVEVGLGALARFHDVDPGANWNTTLNQIEAKTREVAKRTHGQEMEQWAAEAAAHLRFVKNAWRNHAMHPLEKYDEERAVAIFDNTRTFMQQLAKQLVEDGM